MDVRVARIFNTYGPKMHMYDGNERFDWYEIVACTTVLLIFQVESLATSSFKLF